MALKPGLLQVDDVGAVILALEDVGEHRHLGVGWSKVGGGRQHLRDVALLQEQGGNILKLDDYGHI